ncbi:MAG: hypothetical protein ACPLXB_01210 [Minisyncoccia bacterium]
MATEKQIQTKYQNAKLGSTRANSIKKLVKQEIQPDKIDKLRNILMQDVFADDELIKEYVDLLIKREKLTPKQLKKRNELLFKITMPYGLKNGLWIRNLSHGKYCQTLGKIRHDIVKECSCETSLELMLTDRIVASYWRAMRCDMIFNRVIENEDGEFSFDQLKVNILKELNKGIELADRQLNTNIVLLKELKQPSLNVNVKTKTAFVAQNQQLNINPSNKNNSNKNETVEPK